MEQFKDQKQAVKPFIARAIFLLCVMIGAGLAQPARAQSSTGDVNAVVNRAIEITKNADLDFGDFVAGTTRSLFRLNPRNGNLNQRNGDATAIGSGHQAASFTVTGTPLLRVIITRGQNRIFISRDGGSETMRINRFRFNGRRKRLNAAGEATYLVGGQIRIGANQAAGVYRGTFDVTVEYQ
ncbi:MAG: DUF4402 domain-containing protein [Parasphingorhabdus sp.]|uniref:DUF4402 domain-containing protein n=1 Tax=Parasphingorhabdus sp. TaxID=2709688 RepID=UPI00329694AC